MRSAAIDVGSNTIRMLIGDIQDDILSRIYADRAITRLAQGIGKTGRLREENMRKSLSALKDFSRSIARYGSTRVSGVGTSALREAENGGRFAEMVLEETGIRLEIISGMREAELTAKGVLLGIKELRRPLLIIDVGGGSTEWILRKSGTSHETVLHGSLSLGVVRLLEKFIKTDPPSGEDLSSLGEELDSRLRELEREISENFMTPTRLVGTGGTITTLASIDLGLKEYDHERIHTHTISFDGLSRLRGRFLALPLGKRQEIEGLESGRADLIIPGILLTMRIMELFGFREISVSDYGLIEGLLKEQCDETGF